MANGRPTKKELAAIEQRDRDEFEKRYSALENRVIGLRQRTADPETLFTQFNAELRAFAETAQPVSRAPGTSSRSALKSETITKYLVQSRRLTTLRRMGALITKDISEAENEVERLQFEVLRLLWDEEPIDRYHRDLAEKFDLAGLTRPVAQTMHADQIDDFVSHVKAAAEARKDRAKRLDPENAPDRQEWRRLLKESSIVSVTRIERAPDDIELMKLTECGLPPFSTIESYARGSEKLDLFHRGDPMIKLKTARKIFGNWIQDRRYGLRPTPEQKDVWLACLAVKYGFAHELLSSKEIRIPSPWSATEIVVLRRV